MKKHRRGTEPAEVLLRMNGYIIDLEEVGVKLTTFLHVTDNSYIRTHSYS